MKAKVKSMNEVFDANKIDIVFNHIGFPSWSSETWERKSNTNFRCIEEEASNIHLDASRELKNNHDMFKYIEWCKKTQDCEIYFN